ncbi:hypothetical protein A1OO_12925 [Enterovibrio norvegicus FF-33]|uniref:hypothetical protein n=1 Tax=Enterovibrio norvegicus TaxID=188144 RepID=UPI000301AC28|nr:hypothetical protein [Enterovibrio norvegicus]OEE66668.1 hypothetical protein A1OO_12925 [Enterovibrio norvegicus FF-33]
MDKCFKLTSAPVKGQFVDNKGERFYRIENVDHMPAFFMSVVSANDHWLFASSTGCLSAGRGNPENAIFPYRSVDLIHESADNTGPKTFIRLEDDGGDVVTWEPFNQQHDGKFSVSRNLYKNITGDKVVFEEINQTLRLTFQYSWESGNNVGFVRRSELTDFSGQNRAIEILDGVQNLLPHSAPMAALQTRSALVDAYKWNEKEQGSTLALYSMYAKLSDRADPAEALLTNTVFSIDSDESDILLSSQQLPAFKRGDVIESENLTRGVRGAYFIHKLVSLKAGESNQWMMVLDTGKDHADIVALRAQLEDTSALKARIDKDCLENRQELVALISAVDGWQFSADEATSNHHYANVLFNAMRGGVFEQGYTLRKEDVLHTAHLTNQYVFQRNQAFYNALPERFTQSELIKLAEQADDIQLVRLCYEYLPLTFGRRHGDPSRPWNHYDIKVKDKEGNPLLAYQGNWRDIFQNWEALALSYPGYLRSFIAKFVNASTIDGYNPYRITKDGIDWEVLEPDDPWSNIGYWGDHQIIYLLKFLEWSERFEPSQLSANLTREIYSYANVPYLIGDTKTLFDTPKDTVTFDTDLQAKTEKLASMVGSDGKLLLDSDREVYLVNLSEKLLVPLLAKLSNWVVDGGVWLNTQRPEWNDANNAIVGNGLSMVTLYYMRRYVEFLQGVFVNAPEKIRFSSEVATWLKETTDILNTALRDVKKKAVTRQTKHKLLTELVESASRYRAQVYHQNGFSGKEHVDSADIAALLSTSLDLLHSSTLANAREDGLFNAYNVVQYSNESVESLPLYPMLEGQVAALSSGALTSSQAVSLLDSLFNSDMYRTDQKSFMLYPDRDLPNFMNRNCISLDAVKENDLLSEMHKSGDKRIVKADKNGVFHFHADFENAGALKEALSAVRADYSHVVDAQFDDVKALYETVFNHKEFTGRSGTMFGYEGLGCIYWHMVSKLLLAVQEVYFASLKENPDSADTKALSAYYYRVRDGISFNKTPTEYGAFPADPYSHTPKHAGAQQPGMTGQVKEEVITRFGELGVLVESGTIRIAPTLLMKSEFSPKQASFEFVSADGVAQNMTLNAGELAFTYCQVPFLYRLTDSEKATIVVKMTSGEMISVVGNSLPESICKLIFSRSGDVESVIVDVPESVLYQAAS